MIWLSPFSLEKQKRKNPFGARVNSCCKRKMLERIRNWGAGMGGTDWEALQRRYEGFRDILRPYELPSREEFEQLKLSKLAYGQITSAYLDKINYGLRLYADDEDTFHLLDGVAERLGFSQEKQPDWASPFEIVREGLAKQELTPEFVQAWGTLEFCSGVMCALIRHDEHLESAFDRKLGGALQSTIVHEQWFAFWVSAHAPGFEKSAKTAATIAIRDLCDAIAKGQRAPVRPYPREWFDKMLEVDRKTKKRTGDLKATYTKMAVSRIKQLLAAPVVPAEKLPPLQADAFVLMRR
jgi:hypothetical protein